MNIFRAIIAGAIVWAFVISTFVLLGFLPSVKDSLNLQGTIVGVLIVPFASLGAFLYYRNGNRDKGLPVSILMVATALLLDALVTVPFVEIPNGGSYQSFYSSPVLWILVAINVATVFLYWKKAVAPQHQ